MGRDRPMRRAAASMAGGAAKRGGLLPERTPERPTGSVRAMSETEVVVVGSLNQDITVETERRPAGGETVLGRTVATASGGKGANRRSPPRAPARASRWSAASARTRPARHCCPHSARRASTPAPSRAREDAPSGTALIVVDDAGENSIVVVPGANALLTAADVERAGSTLPRSCSPSSRSPRTPSWPAARAARRLVLNASPVRPLPAALLAAADPLVVNAGEAVAITGAQSADPRELAAAAHALGVRSIVITLGARGACWSTPDGTIERPRRPPKSSTRPAPATRSRARSRRGSARATIRRTRSTPPSLRAPRPSAGAERRSRDERGGPARRAARGLAAAAVFGASGAVLVLEILGVRLLAPYVGLTLETYTTIIGVVLAGIALGAADGRPRRGRARPAPPARRAAGRPAGCWRSRPCRSCASSARRSSAPGRRGALAIAVFALLPPATVLSAVTPVVVKLQLGDLRRAARSSGGSRRGRRPARSPARSAPASCSCRCCRCARP